MVVGCGLLGTSVGLALQGSELGDVTLWDSDADALGVAVQRGAGRQWDRSERAGLALVAVPPAATGQALLQLQRLDIAQTYTHVSSVQSHVEAEVEAFSPDPSQVVGGHPLAGREVGGAVSGLADLFVGRTWAICASRATSPEAVEHVTRLARACGAVPVAVDAQAHDEAVALLSHLPQVAASALAGLLEEQGEGPQMQLSGPGLADTTRLAAGSAALWTEVLQANAAHVAPRVRGLAHELHRLAAVLEELAGLGASGSGASGSGVFRGASTASPGELDPVVAHPGAASRPAGAGSDRVHALRAELEAFLRRGNAGRRLVPVKRGEVAGAFAGVRVDLADEPGELARLLLATGEAGVNVEDLRLEHVPGRPRGVVELLVTPGSETGLTRVLEAGGWHLAIST